MISNRKITIIIVCFENQRTIIGAPGKFQISETRARQRRRGYISYVLTPSKFRGEAGEMTKWIFQVQPRNVLNSLTSILLERLLKRRIDVLVLVCMLFYTLCRLIILSRSEWIKMPSSSPSLFILQRKLRWRTPMCRSNKLVGIFVLYNKKVPLVQTNGFGNKTFIIA